MESAGALPESVLGLTFGCLYFALVFTSILWGVGCLQLYLYYEKYWNHDQYWLRIYVFFAWILDTVHQSIVMDETYMYFVKAIADPTLLGSLPKTFAAVAAVTALLDAMVQFFFIRRVWHISNRNWVITGILSTSATALFVITFVVVGYMDRFTELAQLPSISHIQIGVNIVVGFTDTLIAVVLIWLLWRTRSGFKRTDSIITRLIIYTVSSGLVTALWAIMALVSAAVAPTSFLQLFADLVIPKLYFNCMLASLNVRSSLRTTPSTSMSVHLSEFAAAGASSSTSAGSSSKAENSRTLECRIDIDVARRSDGELPKKEFAISEEV